MGGCSGAVCGISKIKAYCNYVAEIEEQRGVFQSYYPDPKNKKDCKRRMIQDPPTGEWFLHYHWHT